eukprot:CAMPEP_0172323428 /NCGR_PEP_ID=MMETSP1058-20130122/48720_1 /TAXON_ID=83371 /ORGANISM="Detonula confervacea, Strain CCMP 353" /LENGTH=435 /DNA_ID=CAMNT_0013039421 /DNA_START=1 /DNA_END=1308 /DNA_ORIENTATION=-
MAMNHRRERASAIYKKTQQQIPMLSAAVSFMFCLRGTTDVNAFSTLQYHSQQQPIITSTTCFAGGGFGASKSKLSSKKKTKKPKSKSIGFLEELEVSSAKQQELPKLDRFGLPLVPTEDTIFPPLDSDISRIPVDYNDGDATDQNFNREEVADAIKNHLGVNLDVFDTSGYSIHKEEQNNGESSSSKWLLKLLHQDPPVFQIDNFFTAEECESYKTMVGPNENNSEPPKAVQMNSPTFSSLSISRRTSTTWFCRYEGVPTLLSKAQQLLNVDLSQMEEPQIVRYRTGEEFSWHYDEIPSTQLSNGGQRLATLLVYLNDLEEDRGGGTVFRDLTPPIINSGNNNGKSKRNKGSAKSNTKQLTVRPKTGTALLFFPSYKDGTPDIRTLHKGEVALDTKMIAQLWIHERDYQAGVPEGNIQTDAMEGVEQEAKRLGFL